MEPLLDLGRRGFALLAAFSSLGQNVLVKRALTGTFAATEKVKTRIWTYCFFLPHIYRKVTASVNLVEPLEIGYLYLPWALADLRVFTFVLSLMQLRECLLNRLSQWILSVPFKIPQVKFALLVLYGLSLGCLFFNYLDAFFRLSLLASPKC